MSGSEFLFVIVGRYGVFFWKKWLIVVGHCEIVLITGGCSCILVGFSWMVLDGMVLDGRKFL